MRFRLSKPAMFSAVLLAAMQTTFDQCQAQESDLSIRSLSSIQGLPDKIAFGSCGHQSKPQPILNTVVKAEPDLFIYLGDNIYGDTKDMRVLRAKYQQLAGKPEFQRLRKQIPVLSVWDDHDYGWNDAGKEYPKKAESKQIFMDFWKVPADSPRRKHEGIYGVHRFQDGDRAIQVILLDTRTFRDPLKRNSKPIPKDSRFKNDYQPDLSPGKTLLGDEQWRWLEKVLQQSADIHLICSSIQFGHEYNGWESWTNLPAQRKRMLDTIKASKATGVLFVSGDVHWGEISCRKNEVGYPLYDITASGLTEEWHNVEPNQYRVGEACRENHFGMIEIDWGQSDPEIQMRIIDRLGKTRVAHIIRLSELSVPANQESD